MRPVFLGITVACTMSPMFQITEELELRNNTNIDPSSSFSGTSVSPSSGSMNGGQNLTITGSGFLEMATNSLTNDGLTHSWSMSVADSYKVDMEKTTLALLPTVMSTLFTSTMIHAN